MAGLSMFETPVGRLALVHEDGILRAAEFHDTPERLAISLRRIGIAACVEAPIPGWLEAPFRAYFRGETDAVAGLRSEAPGSDFERRVWAELNAIPSGETRSYGDIAVALGGATTGEKGLARAVGVANSRNPLAIVVPCHRVIGADGSLTGYAGGLHRKQWLLRHEGWRPRQESLF